MVVARLHRLALKVAYFCHQRWPWLFGRKRQAAVVAVWSRGELLVVLHSYRPGLALPGGGVRRRESFAEAACRELREEVGVVADPEALTPVYNVVTLRIFEYCPIERPELRIDNREIVEARFVAPRDHPELARYVKSYLLSRP